MIKRIFDLFMSIAGFIIILPVYLVIALLVRLKMGRPVHFRQIRPGKHGKPFEMIKIRSMTNEKDESGNLLPNEKRINGFGRFLRSTSLDELPELINVIKGDMSLVGPRPLLMEYLPHFDENQNMRHQIRPGITGWAQVNGRNAINWDEKLALDVWYVENHSIWLDLKILVMTIFKVLKRDGINHRDHVPMPRFDDYVNTKANKRL